MTGRGQTGSVKGIAPGRVRDILLAFHDRAYGSSFAPREAAAFFEEEYGVEPGQAEQLAQAYLRVAGVEPVEDRYGLWRAGARVRPLVEHRDWRLPTGRLDLADARWLAETKLDGAPDGVTALQERCRRALRLLRET